MPEQMIMHEQWADFFTRLSQEYRGKLVTIESVAPNEGPELVAFDQPFGEATVDMQDGGPVISITLGDSSNIIIQAPIRVQTAPFAEGPGQIVQIESAADPIMRLYLSHNPQQTTGRGEIFGDQGEAPFQRQIGGAADFAAPGPGRALQGGAQAADTDEPAVRSPDTVTGLTAADSGMGTGRWQMSGAGGGQSFGNGAISDFGGAGALEDDKTRDDNETRDH